MLTQGTIWCGVMNCVILTQFILFCTWWDATRRNCEHFPTGNGEISRIENDSVNCVVIGSCYHAELILIVDRMLE